MSDKARRQITGLRAVLDYVRVRTWIRGYLILIILMLFLVNGLYAGYYISAGMARRYQYFGVANFVFMLLIGALLLLYEVPFFVVSRWYRTYDVRVAHNTREILSYSVAAPVIWAVGSVGCAYDLHLHGFSQDLSVGSGALVTYRIIALVMAGVCATLAFYSARAFPCFARKAGKHWIAYDNERVQESVAEQRPKDVGMRRRQTARPEGPLEYGGTRMNER